MLVNQKDGCCRECEGQLEIVGADDATMEVECCECGETYLVEPDAFGDGGLIYWPQVMADQEE